MDLSKQVAIARFLNEMRLTNEDTMQLGVSLLHHASIGAGLMSSDDSFSSVACRTTSGRHFLFNSNPETAGRA